MRNQGKNLEIHPVLEREKDRVMPIVSCCHGKGIVLEQMVI
jgi:hypothetical protein